MGGGLLRTTNPKTLFKLLGITSLCLSTIAIVSLNLIATYHTNHSSIANAVSSVGSSDSTNANETSLLATTASNSKPYISLSITNIATGSTDDPNLVLQIPHEGGIATGGHTISISTNASEGFVLTLSSTTDNTDLVNTKDSSKVIKTIDKDLIGAGQGRFIGEPLDNNTWGFALPGSTTVNCNDATTVAGVPVSSVVRLATDSESNPTDPTDPIPDPDPSPEQSCMYHFSNYTDYDSVVQETLAKLTFAAIRPESNPLAIMTDNKPVSSTDRGVYYGARVDDPTSTLAGDYRAEVVYTATAKLPPAPTVTSVSPNSYELGNGSSATDPESSKVTITGTNLATAYSAYVDLNRNGQKDTGEECTNLTITSNTTIACDIPTSDIIEPGSYPIRVVTQGGEAKLDNDITYLVKLNPETCTNGDPTSSCRVEMDDNMIPIAYTGDELNPQWISLTNKEITTDKGLWYDYANKQWANAVTVKKEALTKYKDKHTIIDNNDVLGYWVYIPRYAYEVMRPNAIDRVVDDAIAKAEGGFQIRFETAEDVKKTPANTCSTTTDHKDYRTECGISRTYGNATGTTWATHSAFSWGNQELNGIWVGKFETTGTLTAPTVKPNQHANISEYIGEFYTMAKSIGVNDPENTGGNTVSGISQNSHGLNKATSHMMKNSEWGAVAYLSSSKYGAGVNEVQINSAYPSSADADGQSSRYGITGCGPSGDGDASTYIDGESLSSTNVESDTACSRSKFRAYYGSIGQLASTTNNVYGVYDMAGGASEYVMGNRTVSDAQTTTTSIAYFKNPTTRPYVNLYSVSDGFGTKPSWSSSSTETYYNNDVCTWDTCGGHALHETKNVQSISSNYQSWGSNYANFVDLGYPWFQRGGVADFGRNSGLYYSLMNDGGDYADSSTRVVLTVSDIVTGD